MNAYIDHMTRTSVSLFYHKVHWFLLLFFLFILWSRSIYISFRILKSLGLQIKKMFIVIIPENTQGCSVFSTHLTGRWSLVWNLWLISRISPSYCAVGNHTIKTQHRILEAQQASDMTLIKTVMAWKVDVVCKVACRWNSFNYLNDISASQIRFLRYLLSCTPNHQPQIWHSHLKCKLSTDSRRVCCMLTFDNVMSLYCEMKT